MIYYDYNLNLLIFKDETGDLKENVSLGGIKRAGLAASVKARQVCVRLSFL